MNLRDWLIRKLGHDITGLIEGFLCPKKFLPPTRPRYIYNRDYPPLYIYTLNNVWYASPIRIAKRIYAGKCSTTQRISRGKLILAIKEKFGKVIDEPA